MSKIITAHSFCDLDGNLGEMDGFPRNRQFFAKFRQILQLSYPFVYLLNILCILKLFSDEAYSKYKHLLTFRVRRYVAVATKPVHRLLIRPIVHNYTGHSYHSPKLHPGPCSSVGMRRGTERQTDRHTYRHTDVRDHYTFRVV